MAPLARDCRCSLAKIAVQRNAMLRSTPPLSHARTKLRRGVSCWRGQGREPSGDFRIVRPAVSQLPHRDLPDLQLIVGLSTGFEGRPVLT